MNIDEQIKSIKSIDELRELEKLIRARIETKKSDIDNFMYNDEIDEFIYIVNFSNGSRALFCTGKKAYRLYIQDDSAVELKRKTKDLFPKYETLLKKPAAIA